MKQKKNFFVSVVIVASGKGSRMKMDMNKQYIELDGKMVLARTLQAFNDCSYIDEIVLVVNSEDILFCKREIVEFYDLHKVTSIVAGGLERQQSVYNGLLEVKKETNAVLIHDGARPLVDENVIIACIEGAIESGAVTAGVPVKDTIKTVDSEGNIAFTLDRKSLWSIQTPQGFSYDLIKSAHEKAKEEGFLGTDDAVLVEKFGSQVKVVMGDYKNIKITTKEDLYVAKAFLRI